MEPSKEGGDLHALATARGVSLLLYGLVLAKSQNSNTRRRRHTLRVNSRDP